MGKSHKTVFWVELLTVFSRKFSLNFDTNSAEGGQGVKFVLMVHQDLRPTPSTYHGVIVTLEPLRRWNLTLSFSYEDVCQAVNSCNLVRY